MRILRRMEHKCERPPENGNSVARSEHVFTALFTKNKLSKLLQQHLSKICRWMLFQITTIKSITNVMFWEFCIFGIFFLQFWITHYTTFLNLPKFVSEHILLLITPRISHHKLLFIRPILSYLAVAGCQGIRYLVWKRKSINHTQNKIKSNNTRITEISSNNNRNHYQRTKKKIKK